MASAAVHGGLRMKNRHGLDLVVALLGTLGTLLLLVAVFAAAA
jgi:hypothetical protein